MKKLILGFITLFTLPTFGVFSLEIHMSPPDHHHDDWIIKANFTEIAYDSEKAAKDLAKIKAFNQHTAEVLEEVKQRKSDTQRMIEEAKQFANSPRKKEKKRK